MMKSFKPDNSIRIIIFLGIFLLSTGTSVSCSSAPQREMVKVQNTMANGDYSLDQDKLKEAAYVDISSDLVQRVINEKSIDQHLQILKDVHPDTLDNALNTPRKRLTFWINIYNSYTQHFLKTDPTLYKKNRSNFFSKDQIPIAGYLVSMEDIEHGVLRRGATIWSKGYIRIRAFRKAFIRKFAVETVDYRIHFALNCGAKSCPPVVVYEEGFVARQLNDNSRYYLKKEVEYNQEEGVVIVPVLMSWFSADFGGSDEEKRAILKKYGVIPKETDPKIQYLPYDWTMMIENYKSYSY